MQREISEALEAKHRTDNQNVGTFEMPHTLVFNAGPTAVPQSGHPDSGDVCFRFV